MKPYIFKCFNQLIFYWKKNIWKTEQNQERDKDTNSIKDFKLNH